MPEKCYSAIKIDGEWWIRLDHRSISLRAVGIDPKQRVQEQSGHHFDQVHAEGSIKFKSRDFWIENFDKEKLPQ